MIVPQALMDRAFTNVSTWGYDAPGPLTEEKGNEEKTSHNTDDDQTEKRKNHFYVDPIIDFVYPDFPLSWAAQSGRVEKSIKNLRLLL